ncbi:hypothetical protein [Dactylosporangium cerinum]
MTPLSRRYSLLLRAYPRGYRPTELLDTLLEAAPPGRTWPPLREAANLVRHGLRAHLGRPGSRGVVFWAVTTAFVFGLFGSGLAVRAAWETTPPLPDQAQTRTILAEILPDEAWGEPTPPTRAKFGNFGAPTGWAGYGRWVTSFEGGDYGRTEVGAAIPGNLRLGVAGTAERATAGLRAHGWRIRMVTDDDPDNHVTVLARRDGLDIAVTVYGYTVTADPSVFVSIARSTPVAAWPAGIGGGLLSALLAFLAFGWGSRRTASGHPFGRLAEALYGIGLLLWLLPSTVALPLTTIRTVQYGGPDWPQTWEWFGQPHYFIFILPGVAFLALAAAPAARPALRKEPLEANG